MLKCIICRRAPKHLPLGIPTEDTAVAMAVLESNKGPSGFISVLENISIHLGYHFMTYISLSTRKRRWDAARHSSTSTKKSRLSKKLFNAGNEDQRAS